MFTLFIGTESDRNGKAISPAVSAAAKQTIKRESSALFGGYSASLVSGGWLNDNGQLVEELAFRLELSISADPANRMTPYARAFSFAQFCAVQLNQSAVLLVSQQGDEFVSNPTCPPVILEPAARLEGIKVATVAFNEAQSAYWEACNKAERQSGDDDNADATPEMSARFEAMKIAEETLGAMRQGTNPTKSSAELEAARVSDLGS